MRNTDEHFEQADDLRRLVQAMAWEETVRPPEDMRGILHELRVHQVELEMQNDELRRTQMELNSARTRYVDLYDLAPVGYCTLNEQGLIVQANLTAATLLGVARDALIRQPVNRFLLKENQDANYLHRKRLIETGEPRSCELKIVKKDGMQFWAHVEATAARDADGNREIRVVLNDIGARKQVEDALWKSENRYRALLRNAGDAILIADMNGHLEEINRAGELLLGYGADEICRMDVADIHPPAEMAKVKEHFDEVIKNAGAPPLETAVLCKNGRLVDVEIRASMVEISGHKVVQGVFIDLTERKCREKERLAMENTHRDALVREVHHRIKNNLQGITGILSRFIQTHPEMSEPINQAISQVHGISIIHGLQGRTVASSVRACELTTAIAAGVKSLCQKTITVNIPDGWTSYIIAEAEAVPLALVINELIWNAVKHGGAKGRVSIALDHGPRADSIQLTIRNAGLIPAGFGLADTSAFGIGLQLVVSLLPRTGVGLDWTQQDGFVVTTLGLDKPVIQVEPEHEHER